MHLVQGPDRHAHAANEQPEAGRFPDEGYDLRELLRKLWRRKWLIGGTTATIMLLALVFITQVTPRYTAEALVEISPRRSQVVDYQAVLSGLPADTATLETEMQIMRSRTLAGRAVEELRLDRIPEFNGALRSPGWIDDKLAYLRGLIVNTMADSLRAGDTPPEEPTAEGNPEGEGFSLGSSEVAMEAPPVEESGIKIDSGDPVSAGANIVPNEGDLSGQQIQMVDMERQRVVDTFLDRLEVAPEGRSRVITMSFVSEDPQIAASAVNKLADLYIVSQLEAKFEATKRANAWLNERVESLRKEVRTAERAVEEFRSKSGLLQGQGNVTLAAEQISNLSTQEMVEKTKLAEAEARLRQVERLLNSPKGIETANEVLNSQLIRDLRRQESEIERRVAELATEYGERHPTMINARAELQDIRAKIKVEVDRIVQGLRNEVSVARARAASVTSSLSNLKNQVAGLNSQEVQLRALEREATASRSLLENLLARSKETASQEDFQQADANILSYAAVPQSPSYPKKNLILAISVVLGGMIGVLLAFVFEQLDKGIRSAEQIERFFGVPALGLVPRLRGLSSLGRSPETYVLDRPASAFAEAIRKLHTGLLLSSGGRRPKVVLFTSSVPGEGKTTAVAALARMLSSIGQKVLVIDGDLRKPRVHRAFKVSGTPGLVDCLTDLTTLEDAIRVDKKSGAHLLPAGTQAVHPPNLLGSPAMERLLLALSKTYDLVIIDSAPVIAVSDALVLTRLVDKVVFVVRWRDTRREIAASGLKQIQHAGADVAGVLLGLVDVKEHAQYGFGDSGSYSGKIKKYYSG